MSIKVFTLYYTKLCQQKRCVYFIKLSKFLQNQYNSPSSGQLHRMGQLHKIINDFKITKLICKCQLSPLSLFMPGCISKTRQQRTDLVYFSATCLYGTLSSVQTWTTTPRTHVTYEFKLGSMEKISCEKKYLSSQLYCYSLSAYKRS